MEALTPEQKARIDVAQKRMLDAADRLNSLTYIAEQRAAQALACQSARDAKSTGIAKNNACHIDRLTEFNNTWNNAVNDRNSAQATYEDAKRNLDIVLETIAKENLLAADALKNDPAYNLQTQSNLIKAEELANQAKRDKNKKIILIVGVVALLITVVASIFYIVKKGKVTA